MTTQEVASMVESFGLPFEYYQFPEGTDQQGPYVTFFYDGTDGMYADDSNYCTIERLNIELYSDDKDLALERKIERILGENGMAFSKSEAFIDDEKQYFVVYSMEVILNEQD